MELQALIFDVDGTLAETERDGHRPAFNAAFSASGLAWNWGVALYGELLAVAGGRERIRHYAQRHDPARAAAADFELPVARLHAAKTRHYLASVDRLQLRPGVRELIAAARAAGLRLAIATTTTPDNVTALLQAQLGAAAPGWFAAIAAGDTPGAKKPAPDVYRHCLTQLGLGASACLAIEDSAIGLAAARAAGIWCLVTPSAYCLREDFAGAQALLRDLAACQPHDLQRLHAQCKATRIDTQHLALPA